MLRKLVDIRERERRGLVVSVLFALLAVATAIIARAVSDALLLTSYPLTEVPRFFIISNTIFIGSSMGYSALVRVVRPHILNPMVLLFFAASLLLARLSLSWAGEATLFGLCVWLVVVGPLFNIVAWNTIADHHDSRQARRLFPIIQAGSTLGAIVAGVAIAPFIAAFGLENLLYVLVAMLTLAIFLPSLLDRYTERGDAPSEVVNEEQLSVLSLFKEGVATVARSRLLSILAAIVLLAALVTNLVDFAFKGALQANLSKDEIGAFYGYFNAIANIGNLLLQLFVVAWALNRFGLPRVFKILPLTLLIGSLFWGVLPAMLTVVGLKFVDGLFRFTFQNAANEVAMAPIPYLQRNRAKIFIKGAMNPLGAITAGVLLMVWGGSEQLGHLTLVFLLLTVLLIWLFITRRIGRAYSSQLYQSLRPRMIEEEEGPKLFGSRSRLTWSGVVANAAQWSSLSEQTLVGPEQEDEEASPEEDEADLPRRALAHPAAEVRQEVLELLAKESRVGLRRVDEELLEGLLWREINLAFALTMLRYRLEGVNSRRVKVAQRLTEHRLDQTLYRIFLTLALIGDLDQTQAAFFGLSSQREHTKARALDLLDAQLAGKPYARATMLLLDERPLVDRLKLAERMTEIDAAVFSRSIEVVANEDDPSLLRALRKAERTLSTWSEA